ncbi:chitinase [Amycolatopsis sp. WAC 04182]|uniref:glycoside hydrolase family 18 protein n=1 Tax=Amycolatopsis sp. WAC 04182 TaxID=2203198 RepID=UPI000F7B5DE7|nr:glycosyl hydrolase family 18 protein [Amycolatopsis sp. WAC 04182]RSN52597.1 chitinase [Amycolatopsis sp. WAC 04182]
MRPKNLALRLGLSLAAVLALLPASPASGTPETEAAPPPDRPVLEAFWGGTPPADQVPWEMLNTISYWFASPAGGRCSTPDAKQRKDIESLAAVKRGHPDLTVLISIGGWAAPGFGAGAATAESRRAFVKSCVDKWLSAFPPGLVDGFDVDWEFPVSGGLPSIGNSPADRANFTLLLKEFRAQLQRYARDHGRPSRAMKLSADIPAGRVQDDGTGTGGAPYDASNSFDLREVGRLVDIFNLMTYDFCTGYSKFSCFNDPLVKRPGDPNDEYNNNVGALKYMTDHGVPREKIVLGVPFYGRAFTVTSTANDGLYQPYTAMQFLDYKVLMGPEWAGDPGFRKGWDPIVRSPYLWNPEKKIWVSYENPRSIQDRSLFAKRHRLAGMMMWELGADDPQHSLLAAMTGPWLRP